MFDFKYVYHYAFNFTIIFSAITKNMKSKIRMPLHFGIDVHKALLSRKSLAKMKILQNSVTDCLWIDFAAMDYCG
jgi:hypothetical protein